MSAVVRAIRGNPHALSYVTVSLLTLTPILYYAYSYTPSQLDLETKVVSSHGAALAKSRESSARIAHSFGAAPSPAMEALYGELLRRGTGSKKRHHELTGKLAEAAAAQDPAEAEVSKTIATALPLPGDRAGAAVAAVAAVATAAAAPEAAKAAGSKD